MNSRIERLAGLMDALQEESIHTEAFKRILRHFPGLLMVCTPDGEVLAASYEWERMTGIPHAEIEDCCWTCRIHPDDLQSTLDTAESMAREPVKNFLNRWVTPKGEIYFRWTASDWIDIGNGKPWTIAVAEVQDA